MGGEYPSLIQTRVGGALSPSRCGVDIGRARLLGAERTFIREASLQGHPEDRQAHPTRVTELNPTAKI